MMGQSMNEEVEPASNDQAFEEEGFESIRKSKGTCPETGWLSKFLSGELPEEQSAGIQAHVASCGVCDSLLERMRQFDQAAEENQPALSAEESAVERRVANQFARKRLPVLGRAARLFFSFLRRPVFAYVVVLLLLYPAYLGVFLRPRLPKEVAPVQERPTPPPPSPAIDSARHFDLNQVRGAGATGADIPLTERDRSFILSFFVPIRAGFEYRADIFDEAGKTVVTQSQLTSSDGKGNFYLICNPQRFSRGTYLLTIQEVEPLSNKTARRFQFRFTLSR